MAEYPKFIKAPERAPRRHDHLLIVTMSLPYTGIYIYIYIYIYIWHIHMCDIAIILVRRWYKVDHIHCHCLCGCLSSHQVRTLFKPWDRRLVSSKVENKKKSKLQQNPSRWHLTHPPPPQKKSTLGTNINEVYWRIYSSLRLRLLSRSDVNEYMVNVSWIFVSFGERFAIFCNAIRSS